MKMRSPTKYLPLLPLALLTTAHTTLSPTSCTITHPSQLALSFPNTICPTLTLHSLHVPSNTSIDLSLALPGSTILFSGTTTFGFTNSSSFTPIVFGGDNVSIRGLEGSLIDGGGERYWDGLGSNGGLPKPNHFINVKMTNSTISNLKIKNWPAHLFSIGSSKNLELRNLTLDNSEGDAPNERSKGLAAAHNNDGVGVGTQSEDVVVRDIWVHNQDDCVAVTSGNRITVQNMYCFGSHGLSIGSIGGKAFNNVTNVLFKDSILVNSTNGARIKSNFNTTGYISNITYQNIHLENISTYGIDVQQDYLNGGPTGSPSNGVKIENVLFKNVSGTVTGEGRNYYVLCGEGSCGNIAFEDVRITGGREESFCNEPEEGCPN